MCLYLYCSLGVVGFSWAGRNSLVVNIERPRQRYQAILTVTPIGEHTSTAWRNVMPWERQPEKFLRPPELPLQ